MNYLQSLLTVVAALAVGRQTWARTPPCVRSFADIVLTERPDPHPIPAPAPAQPTQFPMTLKQIGRNPFIFLAWEKFKVPAHRARLGQDTYLFRSPTGSFLVALHQNGKIDAVKVERDSEGKRWLDPEKSFYERSADGKESRESRTCIACHRLNSRGEFLSFLPKSPIGRELLEFHLPIHAKPDLPYSARKPFASSDTLRATGFATHVFDSIELARVVVSKRGLDRSSLSDSIARRSHSVR